MERLTEREDDFESHFCLACECQDYGEPMGCNRTESACDAYWWCFDMWEKLAAYEDAEEQGRREEEIE